MFPMALAENLLQTALLINITATTINLASSGLTRQEELPAVQVQNILHPMLLSTQPLTKRSQRKRCVTCMALKHVEHAGDLL